MENTLISLFSGIAGGLIVAGGTVYTSWLQSRADRNRELLDQACKTALADFAADKDHVGKEEDLLPLSTYIYFHFHFFKLLESGEVSEVAVAELKAKGEELSNILQGSIWREYVSKKRRFKL